MANENSQFPIPRRNLDKRIKGIAKGQKPSCKIIIHRWSAPTLVGLEALNIKSGDFFNNNKKQDLTRQALNNMFIDNDIVRCNIHKNKNSSSGGFSLVLKRGNAGDDGSPVNSNPIDYLKLINPGDWISIFMRKDDDIKFTNAADSGLKMIGIIENVRLVEIDDPESGRPRLEYVVSGRDFGKIFENEIHYNPVIANDTGLQEILGISLLQQSSAQTGNKQKKALSPDQIVKSMVDFYLGGEGNTVASTNKVWFVPSTVSKLVGGGNSKSFIKILDTSRVGLQKYSNGKFSSAKPLLGKTFPLSLPFTGTVWGAMKQYSNPILNEMIVDLTNKNGKLVPSFQIRQIPYSNKSNSAPYAYNRSPGSGLDALTANGDKTFMLDLPKHEIESTDVKQKNVGKSDFERVNAIIVTPNVSFGTQGNNIYQAYTMVLNAPSIQRHGLRIIKGNSIYTFDTTLTFEKYVAKATSLMTDWFMTAHLLYNGTIITDGTNEFVEVGQNLFIKDVKQLFHIEGISYMYEINPQDGNTIYNTEFRVSRGQLTDSNALKSDFIGVPVELQDDQGVTIITNALENIRNTEKRNSKGGTKGGGGFGGFNL